MSSVGDRFKVLAHRVDRPAADERRRRLEDRPDDVLEIVTQVELGEAGLNADLMSIVRWECFGLWSPRLEYPNPLQGSVVSFRKRVTTPCCRLEAGSTNCNPTIFILAAQPRGQAE